MTHRNRLDLVRARVQRVEETDVPVAAQSEYVRHFLVDEVVGDQRGAVVLGDAVIGVRIVQESMCCRLREIVAATLVCRGLSLRGAGGPIAFLDVKRETTDGVQLARAAPRNPIGLFTMPIW